MTAYTPDPELDLVLERTLPVAPDKVWAAWTDPALLVQWFTPAPWKTVSAELDVRPGGRCVTTMESPEGEQFPNTGCYLQVEPGSLLVFTSAMVEGFRPVVAGDGMPFTGRVEITPTADGGTHYRAIAIHADKSGVEQHVQMGFHEGWGAATDQLVALLS
jgi:uncharacterized protein YndB with AHSA1/START domain